MLRKFAIVAAVLTMLLMACAPLVLAQTQTGTVVPDDVSSQEDPCPGCPSLSYVVGTTQYGEPIYQVAGSPECYVHVGGPSGPDKGVPCPDITTGSGVDTTGAGTIQYSP